MFEISVSRKSVRGSRDVPRGRTNRQTDMTMLTVVFRKFANAPKMRATNSFYGGISAEHEKIIQRLCFGFHSDGED